MNKIVRGFVGVIVGTIAAMIIIAVVEMLYLKVFPQPPGLNVHDRAALAHIPLIALVLVLVGWFIGTVVGSQLGTRIGQSKKAGIIVVIILAAAAVTDLLSFPHPVWFWCVSAVIFVVGGLAGVKLGDRREVAVQAHRS